MANEPFRILEPFRQGGDSGGYAAITLGPKAQGLLKLPLAWQPKFFVIPSRVVRVLRDCADTDDFAEFVEMMDRTLFQTLLSAREHLRLEAGQHVIMRPSVEDEGIEERGQFKSTTISTVQEEFLRGLKDVLVDTTEKAGGREFSIIVQEFIPIRHAAGHLSNERRVSQRKTTWVWEFDSVGGVGDPAVKRFAVLEGHPPDRLKSLSPADQRQLGVQLRKVAAWALADSGKDERIHFEWLWDGETLFLLQGDRILEERGEAPVAWISPRSEVDYRLDCSVLEHESEVEEAENWQKLSCVRTFRKCNLPTPQIWVLRGARQLQDLASGAMSSGLRSDLELIVQEPVVVRTDIAKRDARPEDDYLLPRTEGLSTLVEVEKFLKGTIKDLSGVALSDVAFLLHRFIPAQSSAFCLADPDNPRVRIDGIWGLPDGLLYYPHDSYELSVKGSRRIQRKVRFKDQFLEPEPDGSWVPRKAGAPWDWKSSLNDDELEYIGESTFKIADAVGDAVQVMWFVGVGRRRGADGCLPWFVSVEEPPQSLLAGSGESLGLKVPTIRRVEDLRNLERKLEFEGLVRRLRLRPVPELLRDGGFLQEVARFAKGLGAYVELQGSVLSHAYYVLRRAGVQVVASDPFRPQPERQRFGKLVRDRIPVKIQRHGERAYTVRVSGEPLLLLLKAKIVEEALELFWADEQDAAHEELADLLTAIEAFKRHANLDTTVIERRSKEKSEQRGDFSEGIVLHETEEVPLIRVEDVVQREEVTLFGDSEKHERAPEEEGQLAHGLSLLDLGGLPRKSGPHILVPLVPPSPSYRHFSFGFEVPGEGLSLNVRYGEKGALIEVARRPVQARMADANQLPLFGAEEEDD